MNNKNEVLIYVVHLILNKHLIKETFFNYIFKIHKNAELLKIR